MTISSMIVRSVEVPGSEAPYVNLTYTTLILNKYDEAEILLLLT